MPTEEPTAEGPARPGALRRLAGRLWSPRVRLQATGLLALAAIAAGAALLLPPSDVAGELPGDDALGSLATRSIKANRDYLIPDPDATEGLRVAAARAVRPVYDFDVSIAGTQAERLHDAFSAVRDEMDQALQARPLRRTRGRPKAGPAPPSEEELVTAAAPFYGEFLKRLQAVVDENEYRELARQHFSEEIERAAELLVRGTLAEEVAPSRELLFAERARGITVRPVHATPPRAEREVQDVQRLPDLAAVREELARLAAGEPEAAGSTSRVGRVALALPPELPPETKRAAALLAAHVVTSNLAYNADETEARKRAAAQAVKPVVLQYARGEKIVGDGERIQKRHLLVFHYMRDASRALDDLQMRLGAALFAALLVLAVFQLARRTVKGFRPSKRDLVFLAAALIGNLALLRGALAGCEALRDRFPLLTNDACVLGLPLAAGTMLVRMLRSGESSVVFALVFAPLAAVQLGSSPAAAVALVSSLVAADRLGWRAGGRGLLVSAVAAAVAAALVVLSLALFGGRLLLPETSLHLALAAAGAGLLSPLAAALVAPVCEALFGYASEGRLARLANLNQPVLKELIIRAPGTYHHSLLVGALAENAARRIGANPLLARVGGYYHDLGKAEAPLMFGENQKTENRLEKLAPEAAVAVLQRHVADGLERAQAARLPRAVQDVIRQHHGTRYAGGFHLRAKELAEREGRPPPAEEAFRYPGPRPRAREVAIVMLADAVEAASRGLVEPTPEKLSALVPKVVESIIIEGQLDECDLSLAEVRLVVSALQETLVEVYGLTRVEPLRQRLTPPPPVAAPPVEPGVRIVRP